MKVKKLDKSEVMQHLKEYNEQELFYQQYAAFKTDQKALDVFFKQYSISNLREKRIYIEEILHKSHEEFECEASMWPQQGNDIHIEKYSRFMPRLTAIHDFFEILYVVENEMHIDIEGKDTILKAGDVCFISPGILHSPYITKKTIALQMIVRKSTFRKEFFRCLAGNSLISDFFLNSLYSQTNSSILLFHINKADEIKNLFFHLYQENYNQYIGYKNIMNNLFEILLCYLLRCEPTNIEIKQTHQHFDIRITQILQYIENNCEKVTIADISEEFHLTKSYLSKYITLKTGKSFSEILREIKLEKACSMLDYSNLRVEDISEAIGYNNVEHFIRLFKQKYSKTPNQYRKGK